MLPKFEPTNPAPPVIATFSFNLILKYNTRIKSNQEYDGKI